LWTELNWVCGLHFAEGTTQMALGGRLELSDPVGGLSRLHPNQPAEGTSSSPPPNRRNKVILFFVLSIALLIAFASVLIGLRTRESSQPGSSIHRTLTLAISKACSKTRFLNLCMNSLLEFLDKCTEGLVDLSGPMKDQMAARLKDLAELMSNYLAIFSGSDTSDFSGFRFRIASANGI
jgi:hypothetical protein